MTTARLLPSPRLLFAVALWVTAMIPITLVWIGLSDSDTATRWSDSLRAGSRYVVGFGFGALTIALLLYPPALPTLRLMLLRSKTRMGIDKGSAVQALERIAHLPTGRDHLIVGRWALDTGDMNLAVEHLVRAVELEPNSIPASFSLAEVALQTGQSEVALAHYSNVVQREPSHAFGRALLGLAKTLETLGRDQEAVTVYERHETSHGMNREALVVRARLHQKLGETAAAVELLQRAAAQPEKGKLSAEDALWRAKARVALSRRGQR